MPWKDGFFKRNPTLRYLLLGSAGLLALVVLALTFGSDEILEFVRDLAEKRDLVGSGTSDEGVIP